jgi:hypothetical protein
MNRLTDRSKEIPLPCADNALFWARVHEKLARYEDAEMEPEQCAEYARADIEGRLLVLPCKVGDELWIKRNGEIQCETVDRITVDQTDEDDDLFISIYTMSVSVLSEDIGRLVFLTREDAEKALEAANNDER